MAWEQLSCFVLAKKEKKKRLSLHFKLVANGQIDVK